MRPGGYVLDGSSVPPWWSECAWLASPVPGAEVTAHDALLSGGPADESGCRTGPNRRRAAGLPRRQVPHCRHPRPARRCPLRPAGVPGCRREAVRPLLCVAGWHAAGGGEAAPVVRAAAELELFHAFCLIHDDVMDRAATRRGQPRGTPSGAEGRKRAGDERARAWLGTCSAILAGDMALARSEELLDSAGQLTCRRTALRHVVEAMREEVMYGQHLDLLAPFSPATDLDTALRVIRGKTAKYTIERPLHAGAVLAGANEPLLASLSAYALLLGEAFQLRDDLLGGFGHPRRTGKPVLDDLREGKHTVLLALACQRADPTQHRLLRRLVGDPALGEDGAAHIRDVLEATEARATVENMIVARSTQALAALGAAPCPPATTAALRRIVARTTERTA
ncbi:polyprenyl synthetase family protein [Streptomyces spectabilis]